MLGIPGDSLNGVLSANELLTRCNLMRAGNSPITTRRSRSAGASPWSAPATRRWTRCACQPAARRREGLLHLSPHAGGMPGARRGSAPRRAGRRRVPLAHQRRSRFSTTARATCARHALHPHGARRARRFRPPPAGAGRGQRIRVRMRSGRVRDRHQRQSDHRPDLEAQAQQARLHRHRRQPRDLDGRRVRRRRHRHRRRDRDRGDGRRPQGRAQHEGLSRIRDSSDDAAEHIGRHALRHRSAASRISRAFAPLKRSIN